MPGSKSRRWHLFLNVMRKYIKHFRPFVVRGIGGRGGEGVTLHPQRLVLCGEALRVAKSCNSGQTFKVASILSRMLVFADCLFRLNVSPD